MVRKQDFGHLYFVSLINRQKLHMENMKSFKIKSGSIDRITSGYIFMVLADVLAPF